MSGGLESGGRISVSEDKLRLLFAEFKLELVKELAAYATVVVFEGFKKEVTESVGSLNARLRIVEDSQVGNAAVSKVQKMWLGFAAAFVTTAMGTLLYLAITGGH
jgi:hypothetical protein